MAGDHMARKAAGEDTDRVLLEAAEWYRRQRHAPDGVDEESFRQWYTHSPLHRTCYDLVARTGEELEPMRTAILARFAADLQPDGRRGGMHIRQLWSQLRARLRTRSLARPLVMGVVATACAALLFAAVTVLWKARAPLVFQTPKGHITDVAWRDGSRGTLAGDTLLAVTFRPHVRSLVLKRGAVALSVAKDPGRPFEVVTRIARIRVLGTRFAVDLGRETVKVSVAEGRVSVSLNGETADSSSALPAARTVTLHGGEGVLAFARDGSIRRFTIPPDQVGSWRKGVLTLAGEPLKEALVRINRQLASGRVILGDPALGDVPVHGILVVDSPRKVAERLAAILPVAVYGTDEHPVLLSARDSGQG